jgi:exodeoxyribonuclease VII large subunit
MMAGDTPTSAGAPSPSVWAVGQLVTAIARSLAQRFNPVRVRGEVSGFMRASSGHCYFTLKDGAGQVRCAMFKRAASMLVQLPKDGDTVEVMGKLDVYPARGDLQLIVESMRTGGQGALFERFLALKAKLEEQGLFDVQRKRALPEYPSHIGVVTSLGAAALRDVVTTLERRAPHVVVSIFPASVQGNLAPGELVAAMGNAAVYQDPQRGPCDLVLLVRGGGSLEDLWAFNDEQLARSIAAMPMPVVSGVGHETDFCISDFVADLRAPTPTAAAEMATQAQADLMARLTDVQDDLRTATSLQLDRRWQRLDRLGARLTKPVQAIAGQRERLHKHMFALQRALSKAHDLQLRRFEVLEQGLQDAAHQFVQRKSTALQHWTLRLQGLNPAATLDRGFAWVRHSNGQALGSVRDVLPGQALTLFVRDGQLDVAVKDSRAD